jgi:hypothetical protein
MGGTVTNIRYGEGMETSEGIFVIGERELAEISGYCEIAKANKGVLTVSELLELTGVDATEADLLEAWAGNPVLNSRYAIESGFVLERQGAGRGVGSPVEGERANRERARQNIAEAKDFARLCNDGRLRLLAVAGGNSYLSARDGDDIDFFCVTSADYMWVFMLKSLILARLRRHSGGPAAFCFSYVVEEGKALTEFASVRDGLFARDALSAAVLVGSDFYRSLLTEAEWIRGFFPRLYARKLAEARVGHKSGGAAHGSRVVNRFLFHTVGTYVRLRASMLNRRLRSERKTSSVFHAKVGVDHCVYESNRYRHLRALYGQLESGTTT